MKGRTLSDAPADLIWWDLTEAIAREYLGNHLVAAKVYASMAKRAREASLHSLELSAHLALGILRRKQGRAAEALVILGRAETIASELSYHDASFTAHFESSLAATDPARIAFHLRKCERLHPLVQARSPQMVQYEARMGVPS